MNGFPLFHRLPVELRTAIWQLSLPPDPAVGIFSYDKKCWVSRGLPAGGPDCFWGASRLDHAVIDLPQFEANREARAVAQEWIECRGLVRCPRSNPDGALFIQPFSKKRDALYVSPEEWKTIWDDFIGLIGQPPLDDCNFDCTRSIGRIAMRLTDFLDLRWVRHIYQSKFFFDFSGFYIITGSPWDSPVSGITFNPGDQHRFQRLNIGLYRWSKSENAFIFEGNNHEKEMDPRLGPAVKSFEQDVAMGKWLRRMGNEAITIDFVSLNGYLER